MQQLGREGIRQGFRSHAGKPRVIGQSIRTYKSHIAKPARVVIGDLTTSVGFKHHMGMLWIRVRSIVEFTGSNVSCWPGNLEPTAHAQVHHQGFAAVQMGHQIFCTALQRRDAGTCEALNKAFWEGEPQIGASSLYP